MNRKGFTLVEMLVVLVILGVLAALAVNGYSQSINAAKIVAMKGDLKNLVTAQATFAGISQDGNYATMTIAGPNDFGTGKVSFYPSKGNPAPLIEVGTPTDGWNATITRTINGTLVTCAVFVGSPLLPFKYAYLTGPGAPECDN